MKPNILSKLVQKKVARRFASALQILCWLMMLLAGLSIVLALLGRVEVALNTPQGYYENALLAAEDPGASTRLFFIKLSGHDIRLTVTVDGGIGAAAWMGVALLCIIRLAPIGVCFFCMACFFGNVVEERVFVTSNAALLLRTGCVLLAASLIGPLLNAYMVPWLVSVFSANTLSVGVQLDLSQMVFGAVLLVAAYIMYYGIELQDEVDHTL